MNTFQSGSESRSFRLDLPGNPTGAPVIFGFHGFGGEPDQALDHTGLGSAVDTIRVGPTDRGIAPYDWHFTDPSPTGNPDLLLFDDILACLHAQYSVDLNRIWATGHSAGGIFASYLAMHRSHRLAAIAVLSGGLGDPSTAPGGYITPTHDIPILLTWGGETDTYSQSGANFVYNNGNPEVFSFHVSNQIFSQNLRADGHFVVECVGDFGHAIPNDAFSFLWPFLRDHPKGVNPEPYAGGNFPNDLNSLCRLPAPSRSFVRIPAGSFGMGSNAGYDASEAPVHTVTLTRDFWMQAGEVTGNQWAATLGGVPNSAFAGCGDCPVQSISWWSALAYLNARSLAEGLPACYSLPPNCTGSAAGGDLACTGAPTVNGTGGNPYTCTGYRLPTEAEWEYAYRAGTTSELYNGPLTQAASGCEAGQPLDSGLDAIGWYCLNSNGSPQPGGRKAPNGWGLYDMAGNVWELVWDRFDGYPAGPVADPAGPAGGEWRLVRGGGWSYAAERLRAAVRVAWDPNGTSWAVGLRPVRTAP